MLEIKVNVQVGVTPEVVSLVSAILNKPAAVEAPAAAAPAAEPAPAAKPRTRKPKTETPEPEEPAPGTVMQAHNPEPEAPAAEDTDDMPDSVFYPQEEDVRTAMHVARQRIEGEDYKDKPSDDLHRAVTEVFKRIAESLSGQKKPSALPQELRQAFIEATRTIVATPGVENKFTYSLM